MEGATGGSDVSNYKEEQYESQTSVDPERMSSEEDEAMDDQHDQDHEQQQV